MKKILDNKIMKWIIGIIKFFFVVILIAYIALIIIQRVSSKSVFGYHFYTVATGSMIGVYDINDVIAVKDCDSKSLKVGDDIAYIGKIGDISGKVITHRIISIEKDEYGGLIIITKGVNTDVEDLPVHDDQIIGKVIGKVPIITQINHIVKTQLGFFALVFCPLVIIIVVEILQTITDYQIDKKEIQKIEK